MNLTPQIKKFRKSLALFCLTGLTILILNSLTDQTTTKMEPLLWEIIMVASFTLFLIISTLVKINQLIDIGYTNLNIYALFSWIALIMLFQFSPEWEYVEGGKSNNIFVQFSGLIITFIWPLNDLIDLFIIRKFKPKVISA